jgi:hypothetical protein
VILERELLAFEFFETLESYYNIDTNNVIGKPMRGGSIFQ